LLRSLLARLRDTDCAIRANADRTHPRRNGDGGSIGSIREALYLKNESAPHLLIQSY
jgi:hypothetical protein